MTLMDKYIKPHQVGKRNRDVILSTMLSAK